MFKVKFYGTPTQPLGLKERQEAANADGACCYVEQHLNSCDSPTPSYGMVLLGHNASSESEVWASYYAHLLALYPAIIGGTKVHKLAAHERGDVCIEYTDMPAILVEPCFVSNPKQVEWLIAEGMDELGRILAESIKEHFKGDALVEDVIVAFSIGHRYRGTHDEGAPVIGHPDLSEGHFAQQILLAAARLLDPDFDCPADLV
jgi:hypothetical protein